jgi:TRAP-type C4-dicarboxylate transport system substrate-binding protein
VNLVTSDVWKAEVDRRVQERGFKPLLYFCIDPRVVAVRQGAGDPILTPDDMPGVKFRVPGSKMLQQYYRMVGANPTPVAWGETPSAIKQGVADALDPAVGALFAFGFRDILSHVTFTQAVPDSQVYSCNLEWFSSLPGELQEAVEWASEMTFHQNLAKVPSSRAYAMAEMRKSGVQFHSLSEDQLNQWKEVGGYQRSEWDDFKVELAGSMETFDKLVEAAGTQGKYYVHDA